MKVLLILTIIIVVVSHKVALNAEREAKVAIEKIRQDDALNSDVGRWMDEAVNEYLEDYAVKFPKRKQVLIR